MFTEKVTVSIPGKGTFIVDVPCKRSDGDDVIALRMAAGFPPGSIFNISGGKWQSTSKDPPKIEEVLELKAVEDVRRLPREVVLQAARTPTVPPKDLPPSEPHKVVASTEKIAPRAASPYAPGQVWRPKDPRRKSGFRIQSVTETDVIADDGRTVQIERMKRYERVS